MIYVSGVKHCQSDNTIIYVSVVKHCQSDNTIIYVSGVKHCWSDNTIIYVSGVKHCQSYIYVSVIFCIDETLVVFRETWDIPLKDFYISGDKETI
jgi:hypothetical protein